MYTDYKISLQIPNLPLDLINVNTTLPIPYQAFEGKKNTQPVLEKTPEKQVEYLNLPKKTFTFPKNKDYLEMKKVMDRLNINEDTQDFLTKLAYKESGFKPTAFATGNYKNGTPFKARGLFQFTKETLDTLGIDEKKYENNIEEQVRSAIKLIDYNQKQLIPYLNKGYTMQQLLAGSWLGGVGGVKAYLEKGDNRKDKFGTSMKSRMEEF